MARPTMTRLFIALAVLGCNVEEAPDRAQVQEAVERAGDGLRSGYAKAKARVEEVDWQRVYDETAEKVEDAREGLEKSAKSEPRPEPEPEPERWWDRANEAVTCEGDTCTIAGWFTRAAKRHPERMRLDVRVFTAYEGDGWLIDKIRPGSLPDALGFEDGDVVLTVADQPLVDPWARVQALQALGEARTVAIVYRRGDERRTLNLVFADR